MNMRGMVGLVSVLALAGPTAPAQRTIRVPRDFATIQQGIDAARDGDKVLVADGVYTGEGNRDIDFQGKAITVRSEHGPEDCIIDCEGAGRGFDFHQGETSSSVLDGFTITRGDATMGGAIQCTFASPVIQNCVLTANTARLGAGIACVRDSNPTLRDCTISDNASREQGSRGGGVYCVQGSRVIIAMCG